MLDFYVEKHILEVEVIKMNEEIRALRQYRDKNKLTYAVLAKQLDVNISSCVRWLFHGVNPSRIMRKHIMGFLKEDRGGIE